MNKAAGKITVLCCLLFAACNHVHAQVKFWATVSSQSVALNQQFQVRYTIENSGFEKFKQPAFNDFQVISSEGPSQLVKMSGNQIQQSFYYDFILLPKREGTFTINKASISVQGTNLESNELTITVTGISKQIQQAQQRALQQQQQIQQQMLQQQQQIQRQMQQIIQQQPSQVSNQSIEKVVKENLFLKFIVNKSDIYWGERITATLKIYSRLDWQNPVVPKAPIFDGFWTQEVQVSKDPKPTIEVVNGKKYYVQDILIYNLYPQRAGNLNITPVEIGIEVGVPVSNGFWTEEQGVNYKATCNGISVHVKDLPTAGKPADFSGAVGQYSYIAKLSSKEGKTDNAVTYSVKISGSGNIKMIELPKPEMPEGFEVFDPKVKEDISNTASGVSGSKQYDYLVIPRQPGDYKIPGSSFSYFDPSAGRYITLSSPEMPLKVTGEPSQNPNSGVATAASKEDVSALHADIRYIKTNAGSLVKSNGAFFGSAGYAGLVATPLLLFVGLIFVKRKNEDLATDIVGAKRRRATKLAKKRLSAAEKHLSQNNKQAFYDEVSRAIWGYLGDKLNIDQSQLSKENVEGTLLLKNVKTDTIAKLKNLINTCELALYAPVGAGDEMKQNYNAAITLITDLEDEIK